MSLLTISDSRETVTLNSLGPMTFAPNFPRPYVYLEIKYNDSFIIKLRASF